MDEDRFDRWTASIGTTLRSRRGMLGFMALGSAGVSAHVIDVGHLAAKKKKKKKRCKKNFDLCSGNNKCCSKRCCLIFGGAGRFCSIKGSTCCPAGGACEAATPVCCDPAVGPVGCTTVTYPVCCHANSVFPYDYGCPGGTVCCDNPESGGCCAPGAARESGRAAGEAAPLAPLRGLA